jgi:AcrR family transcriptional regulator
MPQGFDEINENQKVDRRIQRTRGALHDALFALIQEKGYDAVTVEEITQRANLGRATFYLHYKDKDDLLLEEFYEIAADRVKLISQIPLSIFKAEAANSTSGSDSSGYGPLELVFKHASENADLYRVLLRGESSRRLVEQLREIVTQAVDEILQNKMIHDPTPFQLELPTGLLAAYFSGALLSSIDWWLEKGGDISPEDMATLYQHLFFPGVRKALGL